MQAAANVASPPVRKRDGVCRQLLRGFLCAALVELGDLKASDLPTSALTDICPISYMLSMVETFAALAEPNRYRIVELLRTSERTVGELGERLEISQPLVS